MNTTPDSSPVQQGAVASESPQLARGLSLRHIMFIALGSAIGTGLFYGSASARSVALSWHCAVPWLTRIGSVRLAQAVPPSSPLSTSARLAPLIRSPRSLARGLQSTP